MRLMRALLVALFGVFAVIAGLLTAAAVAVATALFVFIRRMLRSSAGSAMRSRPPLRRRASAGEIIEVTATEVPAETTPR